MEHSGTEPEVEEAPAVAATAVERTGVVQLRTSARVSKKLKHEMEANTVALQLSASEKKSESSGMTGGVGGGIGSSHDLSGGGCINTNAGGCINGDGSLNNSVLGDFVGAGGIGPTSGSGAEGEKRRARRAPVLWSPEDKVAFFEALNESGKNFEAIQKYVTGKAKKRGDHSAKNREQARYFYYRTWHKLAKHIKMPPNVKKVTQELYGLINFGEMRKKVSKITEKNAQKLNELIYCGSTQVRVRGKTWRIKTPVCRTLRKLNQLEETVREVKLPARVEVVLRARDIAASTRVQSVAHNPRCRAILPLDSPLDTLIAYLDTRWTPHHLRNGGGKPSVNSQSQVNGGIRLSNSTAVSSAGSDTALYDGDVFTVGPRSSDPIGHPSYRCGPIVTSSSVSLLAHEKRIGGQHEAVGALLSQLQIGKPKSALLKWQKDCNSAGDGYLNAEVVDPAATVSPSAASLLSPACTPMSTSVTNLMTSTVQQQSAAPLLSPGTNSIPGNVPPAATDGAPIGVTGIGSVEPTPVLEESKEDFEARIRRGWNKTSSSRMRIGELYIMFGCDGVINLDYWWEKPSPKLESLQSAETSVLHSMPASSLPSVLPLPSETAVTTTVELSKALAKLISIARLYYTKSKVECPCGHTCKNNMRPQSHIHSKQVKASKLMASSKVKDSGGGGAAGLGTKHSEAVNSREVTNGGVVLVEKPQHVGSSRLMGLVSMSSATTPSTVASSPQSAASVMFKQPLLPAPGPSSVVPEAYKALQQFRPKYCNRRGRGRHKSVVVQRMLPLLPKTNLVMAGGNTGSGGVNAAAVGTRQPPVVVTLQVIQQQQQPQRFLPSTAQIQQQPLITVVQDGKTLETTATAAPLAPLEELKRCDGISVVTPMEEGCGATAMVERGGGGDDTSPQLGLLTLSLANDDVGSPNTFTGLLGTRPGGLVQASGNNCRVMDDMMVGTAAVEVSVATPPTSPSRILKEGESQWLNCEVSDFSLSSFLGQLESSPLKGISAGGTQSEDTRLSDVDSHFHSLLAESSLDYTAKFADLADKIAGREVSGVVGGTTAEQTVVGRVVQLPPTTGDPAVGT